MLLVLVAVYGAGEAFFNPAFSAIVPTLVEAEEFTAASALDQFVRPLAMQLIGPALGGVLVAVLRPGAAFLVDAGTFVVAVAALSCMRRVPRVAAAPRSVRGALREVGEGFAFVRSPAVAVGDAGCGVSEPARLLRALSGAVAVPGQEPTAPGERGVRARARGERGGGDRLGVLPGPARAAAALRDRDVLRVGAAVGDC